MSGSIGHEARAGIDCPVSGCRHNFVVSRSLAQHLLDEHDGQVRWRSYRDMELTAVQEGEDDA